MWIDAVMAALILTNLAVLGSSRITACIRLLALQGLMLGFLPALAGHGAPEPRTLILMAATITLKAWVFPSLLMKALRDADIRREVEPYVGFMLSVIVGLGALGAASRVAARLAAAGAQGGLPMTVGLFMVLIGLFIIASRRKAVSQIIGYIIMENGMYALAVVMLGDIPALVEMGILLDAFVAVFVMGVAIYHIRREFDHMDVDQLDRLKG